MTDIDKFLPILQKLEGGFVCNPLDKGGATNMGITIATFRAYFGNNRSVNDLKKITYGQFKHIVKIGYWDKVRATEFNSQAIANLVVDWVFNSGITAPTKRIQAIVGAEIDGIFGVQTLAKINTYENQRTLFDAIKNARRCYYDAIVMSNKSQQVFYKGWINRLNTFKYYE